MWLICGILFTMNVLNLENKKLNPPPLPEKKTTTKKTAWYHLKIRYYSTWWIMNKSNLTHKWLQKVKKALRLSASKLFWLTRNHWKTLADIKSPSGIGFTKHLPHNINHQTTFRRFNFADHLIREILTFTAI